MTNALTTEGGKIYLVPDVPEKPTIENVSFNSEWAIHNKRQLQDALDLWETQVYFSRIEVAEESMELAVSILEKETFNEETCNFDIKEGELYSIEGLDFEIECNCEEQKVGCKSSGCTCKQLAVLNVYKPRKER